MDTKQVTVKLGSDTKQTKPTKKNNKTQPTVDLHKEFQRAKDEPTKLQLNLSKNNITVIPASIKELHFLVELYLYGNKIAILPPEICYLTKLQTLALNENQVSHINQNVGSENNLNVIAVSAQHTPRHTAKSHSIESSRSAPQQIG